MKPIDKATAVQCAPCNDEAVATMKSCAHRASDSLCEGLTQVTIRWKKAAAAVSLHDSPVF